MCNLNWLLCNIIEFNYRMMLYLPYGNTSVRWVDLMWNYTDSATFNFLILATTTISHLLSCLYIFPTTATDDSGWRHAVSPSITIIKKLYMTRLLAVYKYFTKCTRNLYILYVIQNYYIDLFSTIYDIILCFPPAWIGTADRNFPLT